MAQKKNVSASKRRSGASSPEVGAATRPYGNSSSQRTHKEPGYDKSGGKKGY